MSTLRHPLDVDVHGSPVSERVPVDASERFDALYERWFFDACRWIRALGGASTDVEDLAQELFLIARRKLGAFDGTNEAGWLFAIARNVVRDHRRKRWWKSFFVRSDEAPLERLVANGDDPATLLARAEDRRLARALLEKMSDKRRVCFVLFELEGYSGEEIAALEGIPVATVWTRLHHARKDFERLAREASEEAAR